MALSPLSMNMDASDRGIMSTITRAFRGLFQPQRFSPQQVLSESPEVDPRLKPRVPMKSDNIDPSLMLQFRQMGFVHAQEITSETHPELYLGWEEMCRRAGFQKPLQLIVTDSTDPNAITASQSEVVMSTGLMKMLSLREVLAVLGHELGHAKHDAKSNNRAIIEITGGIAGYLTGEQVGQSLRYHAYGATETGAKPFVSWLKRVGVEAGAIVAVIGSTLAGWLVAKQFSVKPSELRADKEGVLLSGDPEALISSFSKMQQAQGNQPAWKKFVAYAISGYPTFDERIAQVKRAAQDVSAAQPPVYQIVELLGDAKSGDAAASNPQKSQPASTVQAVRDAERVLYVPETIMIH